MIGSYEEMEKSEELINKVLNYFALKDTIKEMEEEMRLIEDNLINIFGRGKIGNVAGFVIKLEDKTAHKVDSEILKIKYPEVYRRVCKKEILRTLEIKEEHHGYL